MNKKQSIIISITGIVIVVLALLGLTYAYFVTQIQGNGNNKSVEVSTANLKLIYNDDNGLVIANGIMPGTTIETKTFTVKNEGNGPITNYGVYLENVINTFEYTSDIKYTLTCTSDIEEKICNEITDEDFPTYNDLLVSNSIEVGETQTYSFTVTYLETGIDQSVDMGKTFSGKIQIYDMRDVVDITGTVIGVSEGSYVEIHSNPKKSQINSEFIYKVTAVEPGTHTLYLKDKDGEILGSKTFEVKKSSTEGVEGDKINITNSTNTASVNITYENEAITVDIDILNELNPYKKNTLAYKLIDKAMKTTQEEELLGNALFRATPLTEPGNENSTIYVSKASETGIYDKTTSLTSSTQGYYYIYSDKYNINPKTGYYQLVEPQIVKYKEGYQNFSGKYFSYQTTLSSANTYSTAWNTKLYKFSNNQDDITLESYKYEEMSTPLTKTAENTLSIFDDDYGKSYYYRGDIKDNFVDFAGMCFRIVRIEGDGSIKLILQDQDQTCETSDGNWNIPTETGGSTKTVFFGKSKIDPFHKNSFIDPTPPGIITAFKNFQNYLNTQIANIYNANDKVEYYLKNDEWCYDDLAFSDTKGLNTVDDYMQSDTQYYFDSYIRLLLKTIKEPAFKCNGTKYNKFIDETNMYVGGLNVDEIIFAGQSSSSIEHIYYLNDSISKNWWTISPAGQQSYNYEEIFYVKNNSISRGTISFQTGIRPSIVLKQNIKYLTGTGTKSNAYQVTID